MTNTPGTEPTPTPTPDATQPLPAATSGEQAPVQPSAHPTGHPTQPLPPHLTLIHISEPTRLPLSAEAV